MREPDEVHYATFQRTGEDEDWMSGEALFDDDLVLNNGDKYQIPALQKLPPWPEDGQRIEIHVWRND